MIAAFLVLFTFLRDWRQKSGHFSAEVQQNVWKLYFPVTTCQTLCFDHSLYSIDCLLSLLVLYAFSISPLSFCLTIWGLRMRIFTWKRFRINNFLIDSIMPSSWRPTAWTQKCASPNHCKVKTVDPTWMISLNLATNIRLLIKIPCFHVWLVLQLQVLEKKEKH